MRLLYVHGWYIKLPMYLLFICPSLWIVPPQNHFVPHHINNRYINSYIILLLNISNFPVKGKIYALGTPPLQVGCPPLGSSLLRPPYRPATPSPTATPPSSSVMAPKTPR